MKVIKPSNQAALDEQMKVRRIMSRHSEHMQLYLKPDVLNIFLKSVVPHEKAVRSSCARSRPVKFHFGYDHNASSFGSSNVIKWIFPAVYGLL